MGFDHDMQINIPKRVSGGVRKNVEFFGEGMRVNESGMRCERGEKKRGMLGS